MRTPLQHGQTAAALSAGPHPRDAQTRAEDVQLAWRNSRRVESMDVVYGAD